MGYWLLHVKSQKDKTQEQVKFWLHTKKMSQNKLKGYFDLETSKGNIRIMEDYSVGTCGSRLWSSAPVLCKYLEKNANKLKLNTPSTRVLEVGAGCGISSILLAKLGCQVVATDREIVLNILRQNVSYNCSDLSVSKNIKVEELEWLWTEEETNYLKHENQDQVPEGVKKLREFRMKTLGSEEGHFDVIIGSDVVYEEPCIDALLILLNCLAGRSTQIFIAYESKWTQYTFANMFHSS